jgi:signal transduction histidine kinase
LDTKWKNIKKALGFIIFFLGVSLTIWNGTQLPERLQSRPASWAPEKLFSEDYQHSQRFRNHISNRLELFLTIAAGGAPSGWIYDNGWRFYSGDTFYDDRYYDSSTDSITEDYGQSWPGSFHEQEAISEYGTFSLPRDVEWDDDEWGYDETYRPLTDEQKEKLVQQYFSAIAGDKNLLYSISCDGKLLYTNSDLPTTEGQMQLPEGYNFLLYFDGEKVHITKDGTELDIYGDGYYRDEDNDWYVPGYHNFPVSDDMKNTTVCIAAAKEPVLYTRGISRDSGYRQEENTLYWLQYNLRASRTLLLRNLAGLAAGLLLLFLSFFCRKQKKEAARGIARLQGKVWIEVKILLLFLLLYGVLQESAAAFFNDYGYDLWQEIAWAYSDYAYDYAYMYYGATFLRFLAPWFWVILFWLVWLLVNDLKYNKKIWRHGLFAKLYRTFSAREINQPLARKMAHRTAILSGTAAAYGILILAAASLLADGALSRGVIMGTILLCILGILCFLLTVYLIGTKNMKAAKDVDTLSERINEICGGNYADIGSFHSDRFSSVRTEQTNGADNKEAYTTHDLGKTMSRLEDIRQGLATAVDEQMKSERMKVELIANVSHDIKTPLTSIISYVQFLKEEESLPEHVKDYVKILDEKSQRLKNMVQDVFAVSKAASGELPMHMEELDFGKLLLQTMADMDEQIKNSSISFRTELPEEPVMITADGQRMYRVFQNLFQNALKYSLDGSRVYVTLKTDGTMAIASVKNTSHLELEKDKDFTERFVRGDKSRTDGGSGLGLSIAQSFTEACGGQFTIEFDADLFIVRVAFPQC